MSTVAALSFFVLAVALSGCNPTQTEKSPVHASTAPDEQPITAAQASGAPPTTGSRAQLTLLTYNVLATPIFTDLRTAALLGILERSDADIIALQEVDDWFLRALAAAPWVKDRYLMSEKNGEPFAPGGQLIMAKLPMGSPRVWVMPGRQRRVLLVAEFAISGRRFAVATTHMESFLEDGAVRALQLDGIFGLLRDVDDAVLLGDLNFGDGAKPETDHLDGAYIDVWSTLRPNEPGFTWNMRDNPLAQIGAFTGEPDRRLDWILVKSSVWRATSVSIIGDRGVGRRHLDPSLRAMIEMPDRARSDRPGAEIEVFPSDHYGLTAVLVPQ